MKTSQAASIFLFGSLMFVAGHSTGFTKGATWALFGISSLIGAILLCVSMSE